MSELARGTFTVTGWEEETVEDFGPDGGKLTRASVTQTYEGDLTGAATIEYLMAYKWDGSADFVGRQRVQAQMAGLDGVLVMEVVGHFDGRVASGELTVVTGSGAGEMLNIKGAGHFEAELGPAGTYELDYAVIDRHPRED